MSVAEVLGPIGNLGDHARLYAEAGLEVFPVIPTGEYAKAPYRGASQYDATTDVERVAAWWARWPNALIGHRVAPDQIILDIDPRHGGGITWKTLALNHTIPQTRRHMSGRGDGGGHTWWLRPADKISIAKLDQWAKDHGGGHQVSDTRWSCGIDVLQHDHRYTILPPSPHPETGKPYQWAHGLDHDVLPMPQILVDLLTDDQPITPASAPTWAPQGDSILGWYTDHHVWTDLLGRHGWTLVGGDGNSDRSRWRHPTATAAYSATIRHGCLFVYTPNTPFEVTSPGDVHGYTVARAWATLEYGGDLSAAARAARQLKDGPRATRRNPAKATDEPEPTPTAEPVVEEAHLPDEFWTARQQLAHIRQAAHSRQRSADAVLHVVLARLSAITPHTVVIPAIVGAEAPLAYFACIVAHPGVGKSSANSIGGQLLPAPEWVPDQIPLGSGEGLAETLFDLVEETGEDGKTRKVKRQVKHNGFVYADEGQTVAEIGGRNGSTLLPTIRTIWTGGHLGQANASIERRRIVPAGTYCFGMCIALQPTRAGALLADADAGTPQRFGWANGHDPTIPDATPDWPGPIDWSPPPVVFGGQPLAVAAPIATEVRSTDLARARGELVTDALDAHAGLFRLKVAGLLAVLDGRFDINAEDWQLADVVHERSNLVRQQVARAVQQEATRKEDMRRRMYAAQEVAADEAKERRRVVDCARKIAAKVEAEPERWTAAELRRGMRAWRDVFADGLEQAIYEGWVVEHEEERPGERGSGTARVLRPGTERAQ